MKKSWIAALVLAAGFAVYGGTADAQTRQMSKNGTEYFVCPAGTFNKFCGTNAWKASYCQVRPKCGGAFAPTPARGRGR